MTFQELKGRVSQWLDDLEYGYFTEAQVGGWINSAQQQVQMLLELAYENYYVKCSETTMVVGQADYVLPDDFRKLHRLAIVTSSSTNEVYPLRHITLNQQDFYPTDNSESLSYYIRKNKLILVPPPDTAYPLRLTYSYRVTDMTLDTDVPDVPEQYHEMIALLAAYDGFIKDDRVPSTLIAKIDDYKERLKRDADERTVDTPRQVVEVFDDYDDGGGW